MVSNVHDMPLVSYAEPYWIGAVLRDYRNEVRDEAAWPIILMSEHTRRLLWYLCSQMEINTGRGIPASACRLMERYLARHLPTYLRGHPSDMEWTRHKQFIASRWYLLVVTCIQLAAKMSDTATRLNVSYIQSVLLRQGIMHSKEEIIATEFQVFKALDYRIPLWTSSDTSQFLAAHVGITNKFVMNAVAIIIDLAEYYRFMVQYNILRFNEIGNTALLRVPSPSIIRSTVNTLHLCVGSVCAAARYMHVPGDYVLSLSNITRSKPSYIKAIADIIFNIITKDIQ